MKILFTNSPLHYTHGHTFTQPDWQTMVLPLLAAIAGKEHDIRLVDNMEGLLRSNRILKEIEDFEPDIVGFSIIAARDIFNTLNIIKQVRGKYPQLILLAGGQGGSYYDELLLNNGIDFVVRGEGEISLKELVTAISEKRKDFSTVNGISFRQGNGIVRTENNKRIKTLDVSPIPAWELMPLRKSRWFPGRFTGSIETSRGCPFTCNFCAITSFWDGSFRKKSNDRIIEELKYLSGLGRTHIYLADDNFGMGTSKHTELFERILKEGLDIRFFAQMRTDTIAQNPELIKLAARAGLYGALIGFDTYEEDTFHHVAKIGSKDLNIKCAEVLRENKIMIFGSHIYALPTQKKPLDFMKTYWIGRRNSDLFRMPHFSLLPGTKIYGNMVTQEMLDNKEGSDDFRILIRPDKERKSFKKWYKLLNILHIILPDEIFKAFFHSNRNVRKIKQYGYIGIFRHYFYSYARKLKISDI